MSKILDSYGVSPKQDEFWAITGRNAYLQMRYENYTVPSVVNISNFSIPALGETVELAVNALFYIPVSEVGGSVTTSLAKVYLMFDYTMVNTATGEQVNKNDAEILIDNDGTSIAYSDDGDYLNLKTSSRTFIGAGANIGIEFSTLYLSITKERLYNN